jgi:7,8-dihydropterin-6-yl-methyl-4-(beta-D-ribofuranosyl)aminobenzene 5'-phosphate synthase
MSEIVILYDNRAAGNLIPGWGFSALLCTGDGKVLFDVGADKLVFEHNARQLGVNLESIDALVLSHDHCDHTGAASSALHEGLRLFVPKAFFRRFERVSRVGVAAHAVRGPVEIVPGVHSIGQRGARVPEQAILVAGEKGPVLVTGCAHPGIVQLARSATRLAGRPLRLVIGGFHLGGHKEEQVRWIAAELLDLGVGCLGPCHCTGEEAAATLHDEFGDAFVDVRAGSRLEI